MTPQELLNHEIIWFDGNRASIGTILSEAYIVSRGLRGVPAFPGQSGAVQLPPLVGIKAGVDGLGDDESKVLAEIRGSKGEVLTALASIDGTPSDEQVADLATKLNAQLGGNYTVTITPTAPAE